MQSTLALPFRFEAVHRVNGQYYQYIHHTVQPCFRLQYFVVYALLLKSAVVYVAITFTRSMSSNTPIYKMAGKGKKSANTTIKTTESQLGKSSGQQPLVQNGHHHVKSVDWQANLTRLVFAIWITSVLISVSVTSLCLTSGLTVFDQFY